MGRKFMLGSKRFVKAQDVAEAGARAALEALAVHHHEPYSHMSPEQRRLHNHLRARARQLGDKQDKSGKLEAEDFDKLMVADTSRDSLL